MSGALVVTLALLQATAPKVSASVEGTDLLVGDAVALTIRVEALGNAPVRILDPIVSGLEVQGSREATHVQIIDGILHRTVTRELRLVATATGTAIIGAVQVRQGDLTAETTAITLTVSTAATAAAPAIASGIRAFVDQLDGPSAGTGVVLEVVAVPDSIGLGEQVDLLTLAWFRRDVRRQLRTPPTLSPPNVESVWSYPQPTPAGIVASRRIGDRWYDLFVTHQVLFPLTPGALRVRPATVTYALPLNYSFLSRELQHEARSESLTVIVTPQPAARRPVDFTGAAGAGLTLDITTSTRELREGAAATVTVTIRGIGNVALWPEPEFAWPTGLRVYPGEVRVDLLERGGRIAGAKQFRYLVVADSAGTHRVPAPTMTYFDTGRRRYERITGGSLEFVAPPGLTPLAPRAAPPPLRARPLATPAARVFDTLGALWFVVLLLPPVLVAVALGWPAWRRRRRMVALSDAAGSGSALDRLDRAFRDALGRLVPEAQHLEGRELADALRAAGVDPSLAAHAARARDRVRGAVFGPGDPADAAELEAEVQEILRGLTGAFGHRRRLAVPAVVLFLCIPLPGRAQEAAPEHLYAAGAHRAAADSFLARASREPRVPAHWYNAGNALYRLGQDGRALAAWLEAARLAPRAGDVRSALRLVPRDPVTSGIAPVFPVTPAELTLFAVAAWILGWLLLLPRRRAAGVTLLAVAGIAATAAWAIEARYAQPTAIVLDEGVPLRTAPYGTAAASRQLVRGIAVRIERARDGWLLVERSGARGWVRQGEVARL